MTSLHLTPGYKKTDAGTLPVEWDALQMRDVCRLVNGRGFKPHEWSDRGLPIIRIQNLNGSDDFNYFQGHFDSKILVEHGQLLFAWSGSRGTSFGPHMWSGQDAVLNYHTWKVVPNGKVTTEYLFYALKGITSFIESNAHGASALVHTQKWEMEGFYLAVPPINEQIAIAGALRDSDDLTSRIGKQIAKKQAIKHGVMQQLLTGKTRLPGFIGDWEKHSLSDLALVDPEALSSGTDPDELIDYISLEDVSRGTLLGSSRIAFRNAPSRARRIIRSLDVLFGTVRPNLQSHVLYRGGLPRPVASTGFAVLRAITDRADPKFLLSMIMSDLATAQIERIIAGSNYPAVSSGDVRGLQFKIPGVQEQAAIGNVLADFDADIESLRVRLIKAKSVHQGMMQQLLTGRKRLLPAETTA